MSGYQLGENVSLAGRNTFRIPARAEILADDRRHADGERHKNDHTESFDTRSYTESGDGLFAVCCQQTDDDGVDDGAYCGC